MEEMLKSKFELHCQPSPILNKKYTGSGSHI
jgi:hypothetical protein